MQFTYFNMSYASGMALLSTNLAVQASKKENITPLMMVMKKL
jgi:hypothetical protein